MWLEHHGAQYDFRPDQPEYSFLDFVNEKGRQFEAKWVKEIVGEAVRVCSEPWEVREAAKVRETFNLVRQSVPAIAQAALWWAPEHIYGVPDLLLHTSWLAKHFPDLVPSADVADDYYVILDFKFTTKLEAADRRKKREFAFSAAQVRIYSYMLGHLQGEIPRFAYLVTRDRVADPIKVGITSQLGEALDRDLVNMHDRYMFIEAKGATMAPWTHPEVAVNLKPDGPEERWKTTKSRIANKLTPGRDLALLFQIGPAAKDCLVALGLPSLDALLERDPADVSLEECPRIGAKTANQIRAILQASRSGLPVEPPSSLVPLVREHEFFVDFEFLNNLNIDFEAQWLTLEGHEMIFMVGIGYVREGGWSMRTFVASAETQDGERSMLEEALAHFDASAGGRLTDPERTALYHWTSTEKSRAIAAADRLGLADDHSLRTLPWYLRGLFGFPVVARPLFCSYHPCAMI